MDQTLIFRKESRNQYYSISDTICELDMAKVPKALKYYRYQGRLYECEKCQMTFTTYREFTVHKVDTHAY